MSLGEMTWNIPLWFDIWLAGMAGGAYLVTFLANRYSGGAHRNLFRLAVYTGVPLAIIGVLLLVIDLGTPIWFWHLFTGFLPVAVMSMGTWTLLTWVIISFIMMIMWVIEGDATRNPDKYSGDRAGMARRIADGLGWVNLVFAVLLMTYPGVLLASTSQALWAGTLLLPALFVASALSTGVALLIVMSLVMNAVNKSSSSMLNSTVKWLFGDTGWEITRESTGQLARALAGVIVVEVVILAGYVIWLAAAGGTAGEALNLLTAGTLAIPFWIVMVGIGLAVPLVLLLAKQGKETLFVTTSAACVLLGGLALRAIIIVGGQL
jgi:formate-dependent nitrite reductase membrane component NrfD